MSNGRGTTSTAAGHLTSKSGPHGFPVGGPPDSESYEAASGMITVTAPVSRLVYQVLDVLIIFCFAAFYARKSPKMYSCMAFTIKSTLHRSRKPIFSKNDNVCRQSETI